MSLAIGSRLGPYEITAAIGAGGMGEVYRARDPRLKRDVALKVLPESFASDPDRLARFQREAEILATLNHPNIAGIYGLEHTNGTRALVMEFVEGDTLVDRIGNRDLWLVDLRTGGLTRLTTHPANDWQPAWEPDSTHVAFTSDRNGTTGVYRKAVNGSGEEELIDHAFRIGDPKDFSPDGRFLLFARGTSSGATDLWVAPRIGGGMPYPFAGAGKQQVSRGRPLGSLEP
jgi:protein kinase-like protein/WD40 repeat protein